MVYDITYSVWRFKKKSPKSCILKLEPITFSNSPSVKNPKTLINMQITFQNVSAVHNMSPTLLTSQISMFLRRQVLTLKFSCLYTVLYELKVLKVRLKLSTERLSTFSRWM